MKVMLHDVRAIDMSYQHLSYVTSTERHILVYTGDVYTQRCLEQHDPSPML